jgi:ABC-type nickel/cobalt efflux system permease component RcnA
MTFGPQLLLLGAVVAVGVLHTMVPDHWVPITLLARQKKWTKAQTARAALQAGAGHVVTTLVIALVVWLAGVAVAARFGHLIDTLSSFALIGFGLWIAVGSWREIHHEHGHYHGEVYHPHEHHHDDHVHSHDSKRTALLLILGSSPMVEGIPAFFAAGKYGVGLIVPMAILFALSTIATYVVLCVYSHAGLKHLKFEAFEKYGEVFSGICIAVLGVVFFIWPVA